MKVLILFDLAYRLDPGEILTPERLKEEQRPTEADVMESLQRLGHGVDTLAVFDNVTDIIDKLKTCVPDVVFNLSESFHHDRAHEPNIPALLDLMKVRYTGSGPDALLLCKDKALTKKVLAYHHVHVPGFVISHRMSPLRRVKRLRFPVFVKPSCEESSDGISKASLARDDREAIERAQFIHEKFNCDALIEEYIEGRELYISVFGKTRPSVFPVREVFFDNMPADGPRFATAHAKWNEAYRKKWGITNGPARELPPDIEWELRKLAKNVYGWLKIRGSGRLDVRLTPAGEIFVLEANPNPALGQDEDFAQAAAAAGLNYDAMIQAILDAAVP
jgi:D-alanine-D-alanine ligase